MPTRSTRRLIAGPLALAVLGTGAVALAAPAQAVSTSVVISEVYGGGGNNGATYTNDFVELYNLGSTPVDLSTWKVQYWSATGANPANTTSLSGTIAPQSSYLIQMSAGAGGTTPLPDHDATGTANMSGTSGRVLLLNGTTQVDGVAYGATTTPVEGSPAQGTTNATSASRTSPCTDTDNNAADFSVGAPSPRNSAAGPLPCTPVPPTPDEPETIPQIQGASHISPLVGKPVNGVEGVVTAVSSTGFWFQNPTPDDDPATSEGLFVYTRKAPTAQVGDLVSVDGAVAEYRASNDNLTTTELTGPQVTVESSGNPLPAPVMLGIDRVAPPQTIEQGDPGSVEYSDAPFRPDVDAIDFYESMEGMLVGVRDAQVVGPTARFGEIPVVPGQLASGDAIRSNRGGVVYSGYDHPNAMRVQLDDGLIGAGAMPLANVGDTLPGDVTGPLDYSFSNFKLEVTSVPTLASGGLQREVTRPASRHELAVGTFNVENLSPQDPQTKFDRLAGQIVHNLSAPDVLALEEIQDNTGPTDDGTVASDQTVAQLVAAIQAAGGPAYQGRWIDPVDKTDGGQPGGNIRSVLLFRTDRGLSFVDRPGGDATTPVQVVGHGNRTTLSASPGRIDPTNAAWEDSRKPLVGEFRYHGKSLFVIANHFASKGGDDPLFGRWQQPTRFSEGQRHEQAQVVRTFVDQLMAADDDARVVVLGDLNDFEFSQTADILVGSGRTALLDLPRTLAPQERYTYVYEGNSQVLDHILLSPELAGSESHGGGHAYGYDLGEHRGHRARFDYDVVHTNSEFHDQDSDHEPQVVRLDFRGR